jgi:hypothetical protein
MEELGCEWKLVRMEKLGFEWKLVNVVELGFEWKSWAWNGRAG